MSERDLQNEKLDRIGRKLLKTARVSGEEIEKIVAAPQLFDLVKAGIKAENHSRRKPSGFFGNRANTPFWNWQNAAGALAILIVFAASAAVFVSKKQDSPQLVGQTLKPKIRPQITQAENQPPPDKIEETKIVETINSTIKTRVNAGQIDFKVEKSKSQSRARKPLPHKLIRKPEKQPEEVFYSLSFAGNWEADGEDLQIVRAEISRAELFALGVNLPVENETEKIKTDLLVGADGVARAYRFVE